MRCLLPLLTLLAVPAFAAADDVSIVAGKDAIEFKAGSAVVARYAVAETVAKPYLYPVLAPSGVPQRAQNLNVAAFKVMQWGHCLGGAPEACSLDAGLGDDFATRVVADPCSGSEAPQERQGLSFGSLM